MRRVGAGNGRPGGRIGKALRVAPAALRRPGEAPRRVDGADVSRSRRHRGASALERNAREVASDPAAGRELTRRQAEVSRRLTASQQEEGSDVSFADLEREDDVAGVSGVGGARGTAESDDAEGVEEAANLDDHAPSAVEEEMRAELESPEGMAVDDPVPPAPDLSKASTTSTTTTSSGETIETLVDQDGVTYTRTTQPDGTASTKYEMDGVEYTSASASDGSSSVSMSYGDEASAYTRTVEKDASGQVVSDHTTANKTTIDSQGRRTNENVVETRSPDGTLTRSEQISRPDGGTSTFERTQRADNSYHETYTYSGEQGTLVRSSTGASDGSAETRTERAYAVEEDLEKLAAMPGGQPENVVDLPPDGRSPTQVTEVEVVSTSATGEESLQYAETTYSQTSNDVRPVGDPEDPSPGQDTFPTGIHPSEDGSSITHSVSTVTTRDENGKLVTSTAGTQSVTLAGERQEVYGESGGEPTVSVTRTDTWNGDGNSTASFSSQGFSKDELLDMSRADDQGIAGVFIADVGEGREVVSAAPPQTNPSIFDGLNRKDGGRTEDWLGASGDDTVNVSVTVKTGPDGKPVSDSIEYNTVDAQGNGKVVTRHNDGGVVAWTSSDHSNNGKDYESQTVYEGTGLSIYESQTTSESGDISQFSETTLDGELVAESSASRKKVDDAALDRLAEEGRISSEQLERMRRDGPPYYVEESHSTVVEDPTIDPPRAGEEVSSFQVGNDDGYAVSELTSEKQQDGEIKGSRISGVSDPENQELPLSAAIEEYKRDPKTGTMEVTSSKNLGVDGSGYTWMEHDDGTRIGLGHFELSEGSIQEAMEEQGGLDVLTVCGVIGTAATTTNGVFDSGGNGKWVGETGNLSKIGTSAEILGVAAGVSGIYNGLAEGDARTVLEGVGDTAAGLSALSGALEWLPGKAGAQAAKFSTLTSSGALGKVLGGFGGALGLGFGLWDMFTADSGWDRAAGGLSAAAGAVGLGSAFFGPPGWVVGGAISAVLGISAVLVEGGDAKETAPIDPRMQD